MLKVELLKAELLKASTPVHCGVVCVGERLVTENQPPSKIQILTTAYGITLRHAVFHCCKKPHLNWPYVPDVVTHHPATEAHAEHCWITSFAPTAHTCPILVRG